MAGPPDINIGVSDKQKIWRDALDLLREIDGLWENAELRTGRIQDCRDWMELQDELPRLTALARLLSSDMTRRQLWSVLVPVERAVTRLRVTDVDILDADLPEGNRQGDVMPVKVVVDSARSAFNIGGILRTAECFGMEEVILCGYSPLPDQPQVAKAALGSADLVKWRYVESVRDTVAQLTDEGVICYALETVEGAPSIDEVEWSFPCALVLGNERFGLDPDVVELCSGGPVRIQLYGAKNSLNVVSAFSVAAYEMRRQCERL